MEDVEYEQETGLELLIRLNADGIFLHSTVPQLNHVLKFSPGEIYEIDGDLGSGKTQICYSIAAKLLNTKNNVKIGWIGASQIRTDIILKYLKEKEQLERIYCQYSENVQDFVHFLDKMIEIKDKTNLQLLIVEDIDAILHDTVYQEINLGRQNQYKVIEKFRKLAGFGVTVIVTNHVSNWRGYPAPALGEFWTSQIQNRLYLEQKDDKIRTISKMKNTDETEIIEAKFQISASGLEFIE